jgi:hypothetical protein
MRAFALPLLLLPLLLLLPPIAGAARSPPVRRTDLPAFDASCSRRLSREAASIVESDFLTPAAVRGVPVTPTCPLLPDRNRYARHEAAKREVRYGQWGCGICGKTFRGEWFMDLHLDSRHAGEGVDVDVAAAAGGRGGDEEGAGAAGQRQPASGPANDDDTCFADYCGMLGCPGLGKAGDEHEHEERDGDADGDGDGDGSAGPSAASRDASPARRASSERGGGADERADGGHVHADGMRHASGPGAADSVSGPDTGTGGRVSLMSKRQRREWDRCAAIITSCFLVPPGAAADAVAAAEAVGGPDGTAAGDSGAGPSSSSSSTTRLRQKPSEAPLPERVLALRRELVSSFCDSSAAEKRARVLERGRVPPGRVLLWVVLVLLCVGAAVGAAFWFLDRENRLEGERLKEEAAATAARRLSGGAVGQPSSSRGHGEGAGSRGDRSAARRAATASSSAAAAAAALELIDDGAGGARGAGVGGGGGGGGGRGGQGDGFGVRSPTLAEQVGEDEATESYVVDTRGGGPRQRHAGGLGRVG